MLLLPLPRAARMTRLAAPPGRLALTPVRQMYLLTFFVSYGYSAANSIFPPFAQQRGFDVATVGVLMSAYAVTSLLSRLPAGALFSGPRAPLAAALAMLLQAASIASYTLVDGLGPLLVLRACNGLAYGVVTTVNMTLLMGAIERPDQRGGATGWYLFWMAAAYSIGNFVSGFLVDHFGYGVTFQLAALMTLVVLPMLGLRAALRRGGATRGGARRATPGAAFDWRFLLSLPLLVPALQAFSINALSQLMWVYFPLYGLGVGLSLGAVGVLRGVYSSGSMITRPFVGGLGGRFGYSPVATGTLVVSAALTTLVPLFAAFWPLLALNAVLGGLRSGTLVGSMAATMDLGGDARRRGLAAGMYSFGTDAGNILGPVLGGVLAERLGLGPMFAATALTLLAVYLLLLALSALVQRRQREA